IAFGLGHQADEAVLADGHLGFADLTTGGFGVLSPRGAVLATEIDGHAVAAGRHGILFYQGAGGAAGFHVTGEGPVFYGLVTQVGELGLEYLFIEGFGPLLILHMDFEPDYWIIFHGGLPRLAVFREPVVVR